MQLDISKQIEDAAKHVETASISAEWTSEGAMMRAALIYAADVLRAKSSMIDIPILPLDWWEPGKINNFTIGAHTILGTYYVSQDGGRYNASTEYYENGIWHDWLGENHGSLYSAKDDAFKHFMGRIRTIIK